MIGIPGGEVVDLARRAVVALERCARALEGLVLTQQAPLTSGQLADLHAALVALDDARQEEPG